MKMQHRSNLFTLLAAGLAIASPALESAALAQHTHAAKPAAAPAKAPPKHDHGDHAHGKHAHGDTKPAADFAAAMREIGARMTALDGLLAKGDLDAAHDEGDAIADLAKSLGALALKPDSGVARDKVKEVNKAGKALALAADGVHDAYEKKDLAAARAAQAEIRKQHAALSAAAPVAADGHDHAAAATAEAYACPMQCEGGKTYDKPGRCPVCKMNLKKQAAAAYTVEITTAGGERVGGGTAGAGAGNLAVAAGTPVTLVFTLKDPAGAAVTQVETVHEKPLHLLMVSKDLAWFAHEHPELRPDGTFTFTYAFPEAGEFFLYHDFTPAAGVGQQVVTVPVTVTGPAAPRAAAPLVPDADKPKAIEGYTVTLDTGGGGKPIKTGDATHLAYTILKDGKPVTTLRPYLGAMGHLVIISADRTQFVHAHPHEHAEGGKHGGDDHAHAGGDKPHVGGDKPQAGGDKAHGGGGPTVDFEAHFTAPGLYKGWAQFNVGTAAKEQVITVPFTFSVEPGEAAAKAAPHSHGGGANAGKHGGHDHK